MKDTTCPTGLWDKYLGTRVPVARFQDCVGSHACAACGMLLDILKQARPGWLAGDHEYSIVARPHDRWIFGSNMHLTTGEGRSRAGTMSLVEKRQQIDTLQLYKCITDEQKLALGTLDPFEKVLFGESLAVAPSSDSRVAFARISKWVRDCTDNHGCAIAAGPKGRPPRRLLQLDVPGRTLRLVDTASMGVVGPYVALSYCWGPDGSGVLKTTRASVADHERGLAVAALPQTIQDAVAVCGQLDLGLLWVDALCIVQDDEDDWQEEAAHMMDTYAQSALTLVAREPESCTRGFLGPQAFGQAGWQRALDAVNVPEALGGPVSQLLVRDGPPTHPQLCSLDTRGWTLQEGLLARRKLVWDGREMAWSCLEKTMCECGHQDQAGRGDEYGLRASSADGEGDGDGGHGKGKDYFHLHKDWMRLVEEYSQRTLTKSGDKLVAMAGLASVIQNRLAHVANPLAPGEHILAFLGEEDRPVVASSPPMAPPTAGTARGDLYLAGLWRSCLVPNLGWAVDHNVLPRTRHTAHTRYAEYCAPSWSWASVDGPVMFGQLEFFSRVSCKDSYDVRLTCDVAVEAATCTPVHAGSPYGAIKEASLVLRGPIVPVEVAVVPIKDDKNLQIYNWASHMAGIPGLSIPQRSTGLVRIASLQCWRVMLDVLPPPTVFGPGSGSARCWQGPRHLGADCGCVFDKDTPYACLKLLSLTSLGRQKIPESYMLFLVLKRVSGHPDTYQRIGLGYWSNTEGQLENYMPGMFADAKEATVRLI